MDPRDRLFGEIAVQLQFLTREQVAECVTAQEGEHSNRTLSEVAIVLGLISRHDAEVVAERQAKLMAKRRATVKRVPQVEEVIEQRAPMRDRRADTTTPTQPKPMLDRAETVRDLKARSHSMEMGNTLNAPVGQLQLPKNPDLPMELAETKPGNDPDDPSASALGTALADTRPGTESSKAGDENYNFGSEAATSGDTMLGTGQVRRLPPEGSTGDTIEQPSGAAARRKPKDRAWRNPSRPPESEPPPSASKVSAGSGGARAGTLVGNATQLHGSTPPKPAAVATEARYLDKLLGISVEAGATDLHAHGDAPVLARVDGALMPLTGDAPLPRAAAERVIAEVMSEAQWHALSSDGQVCFGYEIPLVGRFRVQVYRSVQGISAVFRVLPRQAKSLDDLGLPQRLIRSLDPPRGLVLCAGPRGSGKTATCAALVDALVEQYAAHAVSIERPIELAHRGGRGHVTTLEVPVHVPTFGSAIGHANKLATVIAVSELPDSDAVLAALEAAMSGACVLACVPASSALQALGRMIDLASEAHRPRVRSALAEATKLVLCQRLLVQAVGHGRVPALEVLSASPQLSTAIREGNPMQLAPLSAAGKLPGMTSLDDSLLELVQTGGVTPAEARRVAHKKERFKA